MRNEYRYVFVVAQVTARYPGFLLLLKVVDLSRVCLTSAVL